MAASHPPATPQLDRRALLKEIGLVYALQLAIITALVQGDRLIGLGGALHLLVAVVFLALPIFVLDRAGRPYLRYGICWGKPFGDTLAALLAMVLLFPPVAFFAPWVWGLETPNWQFAWPEGYPGVALSHLIVVALPEELFYRGYLLGRLDDVFRSRKRLLGCEVGWGLPLQATMFALGHFLIDLNPGRLAVFFPALVFGWLRTKRKSLFAPVVFHAGSNIFMEFFRSGLGL